MPDSVPRIGGYHVPGNSVSTIHLYGNFPKTLLIINQLKLLVSLTIGLSNIDPQLNILLFHSLKMIYLPIMGPPYHTLFWGIIIAQDKCLTF